ncbi:hypothetical protein [Amycolatopsis cihanbeyliensis]|uniref:Uncharacterized protein n=1 Tax=Amycolatopsis cihanbeyliensis TaxID=1128664 RepID=A0A542DHD0_AMYCI|nr:hypothetical protein [Amycolatopsis cihanbeyliensis]TQJ02499.1 hypothetical protein FB471_2230 [Amycolatopsis cihanbeyliensis]
MAWRLRRRGRRWLLFAHVVGSVGWIGVEVSILGLGVLGLTSTDPATISSSQIAAGWLGGTFYFPASLLALGTGVLLGLGTRWGLVRHYWVLAKLVLTVALFLGGNLAVVPEFVEGARAAARGELGDGQVIVVTAMSAGLTLLLTATLLSVFTPWGKSRWHPDRRRRRDPAGVGAGG